MVRELGAGRLQLETAEELSRRGHAVTTFDRDDAFGTRPVRRRDRLRPLEFARHVRRFVRANPDRFDVVEALQGNIPYTKEELGFRGLTVVRSTGLEPLYREYRRYEADKWPDRRRGTAIGRVFHERSISRLAVAAEQSYRASDLVRVINDDEYRYLEDSGLADKALSLRDGLPDAHLAALARARRATSDRLANRQVVTIGSWCLRKGAADWAEIIERVWRTLPDARFTFLGTGVCGSILEREWALPVGGRVRVVPHYWTDSLPSLLADATIGALPSYVEGYPLGLLEKLAAGLPSVAYDAPGSRTLLRDLPSLLVGKGSAAAFAERLAALLQADIAEYRRLADTCLSVANRHGLAEIVSQLCARYEERLEWSARSIQLRAGHA
jgi:glycosyltransferase involved in cell wall biosynthesis